MNNEKPAPVITELARPYWQAAAQGRLAIQRCRSCQHWIHFPEHHCPCCGSNNLNFEEVSGIGRIETFSEVHRSFVAGFGAEPYIIAWIELIEQSGLRVFANIIEYKETELHIGQAVALCFEQGNQLEVDNEIDKLPQFKPCQNE